MIYFLGPLPPPLHGFSAINRAILNRFAECTSVFVFKRAGASKKFFLISIFLFVWLWLRFVFSLFFRRPNAIYVGLSGGIGQVIDCAFIVVAKFARIPVYVHHHSFAYLNSPSLTARFCLSCMRECQHIVLCERMGFLLSRSYSIPVEKITVLSNAAFLSGGDSLIGKPSDKFTVGFLSNITEEKGILDFFDLAERFVDIDDGPLFLIAGPVGDSVLDVFAQRLSTLQNVQHVGPVYGEAKDAFYRRLDVLAFPTRYPNEAEPVTILEAFRAGVPVIANHRGCIATMLDEFSGLGVLNASSFVDEATALLKRLAASPDELRLLKQGALKRFTDLQVEHSRKLDWLVGRIVAGLPLESK